MRFFRILNSDGSPAGRRQVIIKNPGHWDYELSDAEGKVQIPPLYESGDVVVGGKTVYQGALEGNIYLP